MKIRALIFPVLGVALGIASTPPATSTPENKRDPDTRNLEVCSKPSASCNRPYKTFAPYELGVRLPSSIRPNLDYHSVTFYAVVLKVATSDKETNCDGGEFSSVLEKERVRVQKLFPYRKVFADHQCPDMATVSYVMDGKPSTHPFIAIYGGATFKVADVVLRHVKGRYSQAQIKPMQVVFERIVQ